MSTNVEPAENHVIDEHLVNPVTKESQPRRVLLATPSGELRNIMQRKHHEGLHGDDRRHPLEGPPLHTNQPGGPLPSYEEHGSIMMPGFQDVPLLVVPCPYSQPNCMYHLVANQCVYWQPQGLAVTLRPRVWLSSAQQGAHAAAHNPGGYQLELNLPRIGMTKIFLKNSKRVGLSSIDPHESKEETMKRSAVFPNNTCFNKFSTIILHLTFYFTLISHLRQ